MRQGQHFNHSSSCRVSAKCASGRPRTGHSGTELWNPKFRRRAQACSRRDYLWLNWRWDIWTGVVPVLMSQLQTWPDTKPLASMEGSRGLNSLTTVADGASSAIHGLLGLSAVFSNIQDQFRDVSRRSCKRTEIHRVFEKFKSYACEIRFQAIRDVQLKNTCVE